jgi:NAD(P)-dependent dehydrogenase (short-subunit alcohol dehydrogenase family)
MMTPEEGRMITIDLAGHVVAVTGAAGGIGAGIAARFAAAGASLVLHTHRGDPPAIGGAATAAVRLDLTAPEAPAALVATAVDAFGRLDAVVNNAAVQPVRPLLAIGDAEWDAVVATNLTACHRLTLAFAEHAIARGGGGSVVHIASIEGSQPAAGHAHYATTKAALRMHARAAALELGGHGIRVNAVSPGLINRPGLAVAWPEGVARWLAAAPLGRLGEPDDVGDACVFLCSPLARWITGIDLVVDGGVSTHPSW